MTKFAGNFVLVVVVVIKKSFGMVKPKPIMLGKVPSSPLGCAR
jgi:hypothetical protein